MAADRQYRAGETLEDFCRACKTDRLHTIIVTDGASQPLRVSCGFCHSEHNFRGGPRLRAPDESRSTDARPSTGSRPAAQARTGADPFPTVSEREVTMSADTDLELLLRRVIREETGITPATPADRWRGGTLVLKPGNPELQEKSWPIETFFHKVVMLRNRLRTLEQQVNASEMPDAAKVRLQGYITGCYGTLTSFNVLFADDEDHFAGSGGD